MSAMLPVPADSAGRLAAVLDSSLASIAGEPNALSLPRGPAVVVLADGLGAANIQQRAGHARYLASRLAKRDVIRTVFPSTTAAALASLTTGRMPGEHGLVGYRVLDAAGDRVVNQLNGWDDRMRPESWQRVPTLFETAARARPGDLRDRRPTLCGLRLHACGAARRGVPLGPTIADRFAEALRVEARAGRWSTSTCPSSIRRPTRTAGIPIDGSPSSKSSTPRSRHSTIGCRVARACS